MSKTVERLIFAGLVLLLVGGLAWWWWETRRTPEPPPLAEAPPATSPAPAAEPKIEHPITPPADSKPVPPLADSDAALRDELTQLFGAKPVQELFVVQGLVRRVVAAVDNLTRNEVALKVWPLKPAPREFLVVGRGEQMAIDPTNAARYAPYVRLAEAVEPKKLVALYVRFYPLFQQAYQELGYPKGYFNDRLVEVIDHLLATPEIKGPIKVTQPKIVYEFADAELQKRSAGQKLLLRMGAENAGRIKTVLREVRRELTGQMPAS